MKKFIEVIKQSKKFLIIIFIIWIVLSILLVSPVAYSIVESTKSDSRLDTNNLFKVLFDAILQFNTFFKMFDPKYLPVFGKCLGYYTIGFIVFSIVGFIKTKPYGKYHDIEHGSSDWSAHGEQYKVLSKNKGLILAKDNFLPLDKRGNINTLIVGRIRFTENLQVIQYLMHIKC